ncbi:MAG: DNA translocase FtsK 4TM domain-containing protein [Desulfobulbaceae bacterium]|nr:DNA translocase FtsK 4TM domain-containing protein [Desulfobulbaceae bacterium]
MPIQENHSKFFKEISFIITLSVALFLLLCLVSYSTGFLQNPPVHQAPVDNWCGIVGHYIARYSLSFLGLAGFCPIIILCYTSIALLRKNETLDRLPFLVVGITGTTISMATLLAVMDVNIFPPGFIHPGGYVGFLINNLLVGFVGKAGSILLCFTILLFSLMAAVRFSPYEFALWSSQLFSTLLFFFHGKTLDFCKLTFDVIKEKSMTSPRALSSGKVRQLGRNVRFVDRTGEKGTRERETKRALSVHPSDEEEQYGEEKQAIEPAPIIHQPYELPSEEWGGDAPVQSGIDQASDYLISDDQVRFESSSAYSGSRVEHSEEDIPIHQPPVEDDSRDNSNPIIHFTFEREEFEEEEMDEEDDEQHDDLSLILSDNETVKIIEPTQPDRTTFVPERIQASLPPEASEVRSSGKQPTVHAPAAVDKAQANRVETAEWMTPGQFSLPPISLLDYHDDSGICAIDKEHYFKVSNILERKLLDFNVKGSVVGISPGPVVTTYEYSPAPGVKINKIVSLADDLAMVLKVERVRVMGSIPGKAAIGIEIPNPVRKTVYLRDILESRAYATARSRLSLAMGLDVVGQPVIADLSKMPHLLIAGATGAGKSVAINAFIASILYKSTPNEVRLLMIDPKRIELSVYEDIPHLLHPVVVEPKMASRALMWAVREMERRYKLLGELRVKSFASYNQVSEEKLPYIVIIVDELADLMMVASKDVETAIARLAQMARAAGMHIMLATQRPSVDVLTGLIKANFPTRISFKVSSKVDSRTIIDACGAEHLLGAGDMLFLPPGAAKLQRIHCAYIDETETERIITHLKRQGKAQYDESVMRIVEEEQEEDNDAPEEYDEKYDEAVAVVTETGQASISMVQRRLRVGYNRAARMIELMEREGIVGPADGSRPREVFARRDYDEED